MFNNAGPTFVISSPTTVPSTMASSALSSDHRSQLNHCPWRTLFRSLINTFEGAPDGGGVTENRIYDNSYEYFLNVGPFGLAAESPISANGCPAHRHPFEGNAASTTLASLDGRCRGKIYGRNAVCAALERAQVMVLPATTWQSLFPNAFGGHRDHLLAALSSWAAPSFRQPVFQIARSLHESPL